MSPRMTTATTKVKSVLDGFTTGQKAIVAVAVAGLVVGAFFLSSWVTQPQWAPLFGNLSGADANAIVEQLQASGAKYELTDGGHTVMVPQSQVYDLRVQMSGKGLPSGSDAGGYSLLDKSSITTTDFQQNITYQRALEGELAKTLQAMDGVNTAVVHLALPKKDVFASEQDKPTASVLLKLTPGVTLDRNQVRSVTHLVAGSIEGLSADDVTVSDSTGNLLSSRETGVSGAASAANEADAQTAAYSDRLSAQVQDMLDKVLGPNHSTVRVNAVLNYDAIESVSKKYSSNPSAAPQSEARTGESYAGGTAGIGGALGQTWPSVTPAPSASAGTGYNKWSGTVNNSVDEITEKTIPAPGKVEKLTVAVVLDAKTAGNIQPAQIQALVGPAIGLDSTRGDAIQVDKMAFDTTAAADAAKELKSAQAQARTASLLDTGKKAGLVLLALILLFLMSRKGKKKTKVSASVADLPASAYAQQGLLVPAQVGPAAITASIENLPSADELAAERERIRDRVSKLVDNQPEDVAAVIQGWLSERSVG